MERSNLKRVSFSLLLNLLFVSSAVFATNRFDNVIVTGAQSIGTGSVPNSLAVLDMVSTTKGFIPPRMTNTQRNAIGSPPEGLAIYSTTDHSPEFYNGSTWGQYGVTSFAGLSGTASLTTQVSGVLPIANGGTNQSSVTTAPAAIAWAGWDTNSNLSANNLLEGYATTATAAGTTVLTVGSAHLQYFTGSTTQTVTLPVVSTLALGTQFEIDNLSSGAVTVQSSGANSIQAMGQNTVVYVTSIATSGTTAAAWNFIYASQSGSGLSNPMTTGGDLIYGGTGGTPTRLANGSAGTVLTSAGTTLAPTWTLANAGLLTGLAIANGTIAAGDTMLVGFNKTLGLQSQERDSNEIKNCVIKTAVSSNNLTVSLRDAGGSSAPSAASPCVIAMQNSAGINNNKWVETLATASTSVTASSGSTLGCSSGVECYIFVYLQDDGNLCLSGSGTWDQGQLYTTTTIGASSTSGSVIYCSAGGAGHAVGQIGRIRVTEATAGVYASATTETYNGTQTSYISKSFLSSKTGNRDNWILTTDSSATNGILAHNVIGPKNYITNPDFESNTTTGWGLGNVALTSNFPSGTPTFGSGFSGNLSITTQQSGAIEGLNSLNYKQISTATVAGDFVSSNAFTIDLSDQAKVLTFKFYYSMISGAPSVNFSGTSSNSYGVAIYNATQGGANWIMPAGVWCTTQVTGVGICTGTFQTTASDTQYRLVVFNANASAAQVQLMIDQVYVGPQTAPIGAVMTDWNSNYTFTPAVGAFGTISGSTWWSRRVGDSLEVIGYWTNGTVAGGTTSIALPSGLTINTAKLGASQLSNLGVWNGETNSGTPAALYGSSSNSGVVFYDGSTNGSVFMAYQSISNTYSKATGTAVGTTSGNFSVNFMVPINGWGSNTQMSNDTDTRVVAARMTGATATITGSYSDITWTTVANDTHAAMGAISYTVPVTGYYDIGGSIDVGATSLSAAGGFFIGLNTGGVILENKFIFDLNVPENESLDFFYGSVLLNAGTTFKLQVKTTGTVGTPVINSSATTNFLAIKRLTGSAVIAATESVNARYFASSSTPGTSATPLGITFSTKDYDTHNAYSGGTYTIPVSGKYLINVSVNQSAATTAASQAVIVDILKNGTAVSQQEIWFTSSTAKPLATSLSDIINCNAGDTITIKAGNDGTTPSITASNLNNYLSISRVGN